MYRHNPLLMNKAGISLMTTSIVKVNNYILYNISITQITYVYNIKA